MEKHDPIRCRVAACREALDDGKEWSFYLINDSEVSLDLAVLYSIGYEWGDWGNVEAAEVNVTDLAPGENSLIWRDDGSGAELRMELSLRMRVRGQRRFARLHILLCNGVLENNPKVSVPVG